MVKLRWKRTVVTAFAWASMAWAQSSHTPAPAPELPKTITIQELGKGPERCRILRSWHDANGAVIFEIESIATGQRMTVVENGAVKARAGSQPGSRMETMATRIYHWTGTTPPADAPVPPAVSVAPAVKAPSSAAAAAKPQAVERLQPVPSRTTAVTVSQPTRKATAPSAVAVESAQPSDWHKSWGKAVDGKAKAAPAIDLPRANASRPDPLKEPQAYTRHAQNEGGTATPAVPRQNAPLPKAEKLTLAPQQPAAGKPAQVQPAVPNKMPAAAVTAMPADGNTTSVPCVECPPKFSLLRRAVPCIECKKEVCACQPAAPPAAPPAPVAQCPPQQTDRLEIVKNSNTLVDVFKRLHCNPSGAPIEWTPMERGLTFGDKLHNALAESQARREARAELVAVRKAALAAEKAALAPTAAAAPVVVKQDRRPAGTQSVVAARDGKASGAAPVAVMIIPAVRNPQTLRPQKQQVVQEQKPLVPRSEIENAFTEMEPPQRAGLFASKGKQLPVENEDVNAFSEPPENVPDGALPRTMRTASQHYVGMYPGYGGAPGGIHPYGFNQALASSMRPPGGMPLRALTVPGTVYMNDAPERLPVSEGKPSEPSANQPAVDVQQMVTLLKSALYPSHREWAADNLAAVDWRQNPQVVEALVKAAKDDKAATVRAGCVRGLGAMHANTPVVLATLQSLKFDNAPQVAQEADRVLGQLGTAK